MSKNRWYRVEWQENLDPSQWVVFDGASGVRIGQIVPRTPSGYWAHAHNEQREVRSLASLSDAANWIFDAMNSQLQKVVWPDEEARPVSSEKTDRQPHPSNEPRGNLDALFTYHPPKGERNLLRYEALRDAARDFATEILRLCPPCADTNAAIRKVREAVMTANAAIALEPES